MRRAGIVAQAGAEYVGARLEGGSRILLWRLADGTVTEQRCPVFNLKVAARRRGIRIMR
jgi:hypothetical protein